MTRTSLVPWLGVWLWSHVSITEGDYTVGSTHRKDVQEGPSSHLKTILQTGEALRVLDFK